VLPELKSISPRTSLVIVALPAVLLSMKAKTPVLGFVMVALPAVLVLFNSRLSLLVMTAVPALLLLLNCTTKPLTMVKNLDSCLEKAEQYAAVRKFDVSVLMIGRLAPDMQAFPYQVQSACDYVKAATAWLSGQMPPRHEDNEWTIDDLRARIQTTVAFAEGMKEEQYAGAANRKVKLSWAPGKVIGGKDYLLQMTVPNTFFSHRDGLCRSPP
jgi:hypothetical protein